MIRTRQLTTNTRLRAESSPNKENFSLAQRLVLRRRRAADVAGRPRRTGRRGIARARQPLLRLRRRGAKAEEIAEGLPRSGRLRLRRRRYVLWRLAGRGRHGHPP